MAQSLEALLSQLQDFVEREQEAAAHKLMQVWQKPLQEKLDSGWTQRFSALERGDSPTCLRARLDDTESRFREGDLLVLHTGDPLQPLGRGWTIESEEDGCWILGSAGAGRPDDVLAAWQHGVAYADPDGLDLTRYYREALDEIASTANGREVILPLLAGDVEPAFDAAAYDRAHAVSLAEGLNAQQAHAVATACSAEHVACIQGPPGTGKTRVLALIAELLVDEGARVLVTSHTHMAINNALNKIHGRGVPAVKVGALTQRRGLEDGVECLGRFSEWSPRPRGGYVVGATPFATCGSRLEGCEFDVVIFDEASQVTVPLALMAMRRAKRFIFIGDHKQLPPVVLSRSASVIDDHTVSAFAALTSRRPADERSVMLTETYRMNRWLTDWPSQTYYAGALRSEGPNRERRLAIGPVGPRFARVLDPQASGVFIPTRDRRARTRNVADAQLVAELCRDACAAGLAPGDIGIVTPYRAQGRAIRTLLQDTLGREAARQIVADTVERMQGQERQMVVLSLATGDDVFLGAVAEFFFQPERLNVSITRAVCKLVVIGPELREEPSGGDDALRQAVAEYAAFIGQLERVEA